MPMPVRNRQRFRPNASVWNAITTEVAAYHSREKVKMVRRPNRSATKPNTSVPTNRPANNAATNPAIPDVPNRPGVVGVRMCSRTRPGAT